MTFDSSAWLGNLVSPVDFGGNNPEHLPIVVTITDTTDGSNYYVGWSGTEGTVTKVTQDGKMSLDGSLSAGESKTYPNWEGSGKDLVIKVKQVASDANPAYATVVIAVKDTPAPTKTPTEPPVAPIDEDIALEMEMSMLSDEEVDADAPEQHMTLGGLWNFAQEFGSLVVEDATEKLTATKGPTISPTPEPTISPTRTPTQAPVCTGMVADKIGEGFCLTSTWSYYDYLYTTEARTKDACQRYCMSLPNSETAVVGFEIEAGSGCSCILEDGQGPELTHAFLWQNNVAESNYDEIGTGPPANAFGAAGVDCYAFTEQVIPCPPGV